MRHGSIEIVLDAIGSAHKLLEAGIYLAPFASHIVDVAQSALGIFGMPIGTKADQKLVASIANPVAKGRAQQINLVIHGNPTFNITSEIAAQLVERLSPPPREAFEQAAQATQLMMLDEQQHHRLMADGLIGTALQVDGEWYARLENGRGVLVPIFNLGGVILAHRDLYRFQGYAAQGNRGEIIGINVTTAHPLDGHQPNQVFQHI
ncbi:hypothetical protein J1C56_08830 [Aminobacter anthyllidis]|uniref:Uncharacterized protein n=1 Tax=Aminobacter anthyllidis TaxID=1035067 RepID=A0A9X1A9S6_9HYPH|nr:hypothetical protein [Aminobacter anthyllidis]MBT1155696.1 hypothetical protein [Aminobacter anthyllidis]